MERLTKHGYKWYVEYGRGNKLNGEHIDRLANYEDAEEQREKGCEFCIREKQIELSSKLPGKWILRIGNWLNMAMNKLEIEHQYDRLNHSVRFEIYFCPMCGRKLGEPHE
jgi:hypothetical protein